MSPREWVEKDFYAVLGVPQGADQADIKKAYKKLAKANHPDAHPDDPKAEARFKEVSEAYSVVGDEQRRSEYDEARRLFGAGAGRFRRPGGTGCRRAAGRRSTWATCSAASASGSAASATCSATSSAAAAAPAASEGPTSRPARPSTCSTPSAGRR